MRVVNLVKWGFFLALLAGCADTQRSEPEPSPQSNTGTTSAIGSITPSAKVVRTLVRQSAKTSLSLQTLPNALCEIGDATNNAPMHLFSDERGVLSFYGSPIDVSGSATELTLTCRDGQGHEASVALELQIDDEGSDRVAAEAAEREALRALPFPSATTLPALSELEASKLSDGDLLRLGYPPRPSADATSTHQRRWLEAVGKPITVVAPGLVEDSSVHYALPCGGTYGSCTDTCCLESSGNWSGLILEEPGIIYGMTTATFNVPEVSASSSHAAADAAVWVGLDGWTTGDVVQDGTDSRTYMSGNSVLIEYLSWIEYYPAAPEFLSNVQVVDGNTITAWSWVSNSTGHDGSTIEIDNGGYGWFYLLDTTTNVGSGYLDVPLPSGAPAYAGTTAEWIVEKADTYLADYDKVTVKDMSARGLGGKVRTYLTDQPYLNVNMIDSDTTSEASIDSAGDLFVQWENYQ